MRGLNIGAGRAQFPVTEENKAYSAHLGHGLLNCPAAFDTNVEWVNIDRVIQRGIAEQVNVFRYPWIKSSTGLPFEDNSFDIVWCSHILEHIPHPIKLHEPKGKYIMWPYLAELAAEDGDGWFAFHHEVWRLLKPGGLYHIIAPYAWSFAGASDPTHTRLILPGSFSYFIPNPNAPFDYDIPYQFRQTDRDGNPNPDIVFRFVDESLDYTRELEITQRYMDDNPGAPDIEDRRKHYDTIFKQLGRHLTINLNQIEDMSLILKAIK